MQRLGFTWGRSYHLSPSEMVSLTQHAEALGYDSIWETEAWGRDALISLTHLASKTTRIKLATSIVTAYSRTPALLAQAVGTLDQFSGGRVLLGLGVSGPKVIEDWHGLKWQNPIQRTREYVDILRLVLSQQVVNYDGKLFHLKDFRLQFKPLRSRVPVYIGAVGPKNIQLTGEIADGWVPMELSLASYPRFKQELDKGAQSSGRNPDEIDVALMLVVSLTEGSDDLAMKLLRRDVARRIGARGPYHYKVVAGQGFEEECREISRLWAEGKQHEAASYIPERLLKCVSMYGTREEIKEGIAQARAAGIKLPILTLASGTPAHLIHEALTALAPAE